MSLIITAPNQVYSLENNINDKLFIAGGITGCENWQLKMINELKDLPRLTIYNPRRLEFSMDNLHIQNEQITWEFEMLKKCNLLSFWFSKETIQPITLYELGMHGNSNDNKNLFVGIDPDYPRINDVMIQTSLADDMLDRHTIIHHSIESLCEEIKMSICCRDHRNDCEECPMNENCGNGIPNTDELGMD